MNYRKLAAFAAVLTMITSAVSCGSESGGGDPAGTTSSVSEDGSINPEKESDGTGTTTTSKNSSKTTSKTTEKSSISTTEKAEAGTTSSGTSAGSSSGGNSSGGSATTTKAASSGGQSSQGTTTSDDEEKTYDAEITLGSTPKVTGNNVKVDGSVVTITAGGDYLFTGSIDNGQICVNTGESEEKVTVVLNGVKISNSSAPAIFIEEAKRCTIKSKAGSVNYVTSDVVKKGVQDTGAIFSNDTVRLKGGGELNITATASHGINADDDVIIESGTYIIDSRKSGIIANDDVTISDGDVTIMGGTNGVKSKGSVNFNGGTIHISGGTKEEKHSIYAVAFNYTGGTVFASGNKFTEPQTSAAPYVGFGFKNGGSADSELVFYVNGKEQGRLTPHKDFMSAVMFLPDLSVGDTVSLTVDGKSAGEFKISDTKNEFTIG